VLLGQVDHWAPGALVEIHASSVLFVGRSCHGDHLYYQAGHVHGNPLFLLCCKAWVYMVSINATFVELLYVRPNVSRVLS